MGDTMGIPEQKRQLQLVKECLSGSESAWDVFYGRYHTLIRNVVRRQAGIAPQEMEDVIQNVFVSLMSALKTYDPAYSLPNFICMIAERVCVDGYRRRKAAKRDGFTDPIEHHNGGQDSSWALSANVDNQEEELVRAELVDLLRRGFRSLASRCRELLRLRYYEELPYGEISEIVGAAENTLMVQARRCIDELRAQCDELQRKGFKR